MTTASAGAEVAAQVDEPDAAPSIGRPAPIAPGPAALSAPQSLVRRFLGRFALLAFGLYHVPLFLNDYPTFGGGGFRDEGIARSWGHVFGQVGLWTARHVFGLTGPMPQALEGDNGDTAAEWCRLLVGVVVALVVAVSWTVADRRRPRARWVEGALQVVLRYSIILGLASYGMAKLYPVQFGRLFIGGLEQRVGELSPFALAWRFMEYSRGYSTFAGIMEMAVVVLLTFRRTATLGALICIPVLTNVTVMDLCYGVPVKLFSGSMVVSAAVIVVFDARRLVNVLVLRRAAAAPPPTLPFRSRRWNQLRWPVKVVIVGGVIVSSAVVMRENLAKFAADEASPVYGTWEVRSFVAGGRELTQTAEAARWRRVVMTSHVFLVRLEDDTLVFCRSKLDEATHTVEATCPRTHHEASLRWSRAGTELQLGGTFDHASVTASLTLRDDSQLPLLRARFQWTQD